MSEFDYDLFVIGAGSGGVRAARIAAQHGAKVAVAEEYRVGGTCVIRGCVPKKLMVYASQFSEQFEDARGYGWSVTQGAFDWDAFCARRDAEIDRLNEIYITNLTKAGAALVRSRAVVEGPHTVRILSDNRIVSARYILIATGATPWYDEKVPGIEHVISSNEIFHLPKVPEKLVIAGGGYIGVEFAGIFNGLGANVTLVHRGSEILRGFDEDMRHAVRSGMQDRGVNFIFNRIFSKIEKTADGLTITLSDGQTVLADHILFAAGRWPHTEGLGLGEVGVRLGEKGAVLVDEESRTSVPSIYAVGDVTDRAALTPVAIREGHAFADTVFGNNRRIMDHATIPTAVFSQPELGTVGLTEHEAISTYPSIDVYIASFRPMRTAFLGRNDRIEMKVIVDAETDIVVGVHMVGEGAGELSQILGIAVKMGVKKADFDATVAVHPTASEEFVTMGAPARQLRREAA